MDFLDSKQISDNQVTVLEALAESAAKPDLNFLEIGSWVGDSSVVLGKIAQKHNGRLFCVDWWRGSEETGLDAAAAENDVFSLFWARICKEGLEDVVVPIRTLSDVALKFLKKESFNLVFIDGDHRYSQVLRDIKNCIPLIEREGGVLCGHDCEGYVVDYHADFLKAGKVADTSESVHCGVILAVGESFKDYSINHSIWSVRYSKKSKTWDPTTIETPELQYSKQDLPPPLGHTSKYRVYRFGKKVYAIPASLGSFEVTEDSISLLPEVIVGNSVSQISSLVEEEVRVVLPPLLLECYRNYNLILYNEEVLGVHLSLGPVDITEVSDDDKKKFEARGDLFHGKSKNQVKDKINSYPRLVLLKYGNYNIFSYKKQYYAVHKNLGSIAGWGESDFTKALESFQCFIGDSQEEVQSLLKDKDISSLEDLVVKKDKDISSLEDLVVKKDKDIGCLEKELEIIRNKKWYKVMVKVEKLWIRK